MKDQENLVACIELLKDLGLVQITNQDAYGMRLAVGIFVTGREIRTSDDIEEFKTLLIQRVKVATDSLLNNLEEVARKIHNHERLCKKKEIKTNGEDPNKII